MAEHDRESAIPPSPASFLTRTVALADGTLRLDVFLSQQPEVGSRPRAQALIKNGQARVDDRPGKPGLYLQPGQIVEFDPSLGTETPGRSAVVVPSPPEIVYEDPCLLVVDKPAGLVAHPPAAARVAMPSVASWAEAARPGLPVLAGADRPGIVHRLDRETSGLMVLPKTDESFQFLKGEFKARRVTKEYRALSFGEARFQSDHIERNIASHPKKGDRMTVVKVGGRVASTYYEVVERFRGFTLFGCWPKTGRTHQIRVHLTSIGHSLIGDRFYRARNLTNAQLPDGAPDPQRHCLHAHRLGFRHPHTHQEMAFVAPVPPDMTALVDWLRQHRQYSRNG